MQPLKTITQLTALAGLALTGYGFCVDEFSLFETAALTVFFFWAHVYGHTEITI